MTKLVLLTVLLLSSCLAFAIDGAHETSSDYAQVISVEAIQKSNNTWCFNTRVQHKDQGWDHYADEWKVVDQGGNDLGVRTLASMP